MGLRGINYGWFCVAGGVCVHLCIGCLYLWGNITVAVTSYIRRFEPNTTFNDTLYVFAAILGVEGITLLLGGYVEQRFGAKVAILVGGGLVGIGTLFSMFAKSLAALSATFGIMFGFGNTNL